MHVKTKGTTASVTSKGSQKTDSCIKGNEVSGGVLS